MATPGTGVNTRGGQVLMRYQHPRFQFKVRHLLLGQSRPPSCITSPPFNNVTDGPFRLPISNRGDGENE